MVKKITAGLIVLMGISIVGIIIVQLIWMENAIRLRNEQFDRGVTDALRQTVERLEKIHDVKVIRGIALPDPAGTFQVRALPPAPPPAVWRSTTFFSKGAHSGRVSGKRNNEKLEIALRRDSGKVVLHNAPAHTVVTEVEKDGHVTVNSIMVVNGDTLKDIDLVFNRGLTALDSIRGVMDSSEVVNTTIRHKVSVRAQRLRNLAEQAVTEIKVLDNPQINRQELENILGEELSARKLFLPYQYGIVKGSALVMASERPDTLALISAPFRCELYPNNLFRRNIDLSLYFPSRDRFVLRSVGWLLGISFLFSMIILVAFSFSVFFLLRQKKISEMKADFINNMTHEFKTPIATISVASDSILDRKVIGNQEKVEYFAGMIKKENERMNRQVEDILTIARLEKKELEFKWETVDLHEIITEVCDVIRVQVESRGGSVTEHLAAAKADIMADRQHISHVVFNLLDNANKYSPEHPEITVRTSGQDAGIVLSVTDKGTGMTRQARNRIFERFYRQPSGNVHNVKGFGLGLSYVKAVVEAHKGTISVESEPGAGSTFTLFFPFRHLN